jgi:outer membrane protein OmpA-like peptidoglycan-associated protein
VADQPAASAVALQRHSIQGAPPPPPEENDLAAQQQAVQRHSIQGAPPPPPEEDNLSAQQSGALQRSPVPVQAAFGRGSVLSRQAGVQTGLVQRNLVQATKDYEKFLAEAPYRFPNYTTGLNGKFDVEYKPADKVAYMTVKVKFDFADDQPVPGENQAAKDARTQRHQTYRRTFVNTIIGGWGKKFQFQNVREPASIWGRLNPTTVQVDVKEVTANQHFTIQVKAANQGAASVGGGVAKLGKDLTPKEAFNPSTGANEVAMLQAIAPNIMFDQDQSAIPQAGKNSLNFLASYLKQINNPKMKLTLAGFANDKAQAAANTPLARQRAEAVKTFLTTAGLTNHTLESGGTGQAGPTAPAGRKVTMTASLHDPNWKNVQDVTMHEFGHMIGLDDEYAAGRGLEPTHYNLAKKAFGEDYAKKTVLTNLGDRASIMEGGNDVRIQHYVTFWEALVETTLRKASVPTPKFGYDDWKFIGA